MASDVERTLTEIVANEGQHSQDWAKGVVSALKKSGRYQADVY